MTMRKRISITISMADFVNAPERDLSKAIVRILTGAGFKLSFHHGLPDLVPPFRVIEHPGRNERTYEQWLEPEDAR